MTKFLFCLSKSENVDRKNKKIFVLIAKKMFKLSKKLQHIFIKINNQIICLKFFFKVCFAYLNELIISE